MKNTTCETPFKVGFQSDIKPSEANHVQTAVIGQTLRGGRVRGRAILSAASPLLITRF
jgi:hypothetical protein